MRAPSPIACCAGFTLALNVFIYDPATAGKLFLTSYLRSSAAALSVLESRKTTGIREQIPRRFRPSSLSGQFICLKKKWKVLLILGLLVVAAVSVSASINISHRGIVTVQTGKVGRLDLTSLVTASGEVKPRNYINIGANA